MFTASDIWPADITGDERFPCGVCTRTFRTAAAAGAHRKRTHNIGASYTAAFGTACQVCHREFWTNRRLQLHLKVNPVCEAVVLASDIEGTEVDNRAGDCSHYPVTALVGPQPFWATLRPPIQHETHPDPSSPEDLSEVLRWRETPLTVGFFAARQRLVVDDDEESLRRLQQLCTGSKEDMQFADKGQSFEEGTLVSQGGYSVYVHASAFWIGKHHDVTTFQARVSACRRDDVCL